MTSCTSCGKTPSVGSIRRAVKVNLIIDQGTTFELPIECKEGDVPIDITDAIVKCQFRQRVDLPTILIKAETGNGITITGGAQGKMVMTLTPEQTRNLTIYEGVWDMFITFPSGVVNKLLEGSFTISRGVTRD